MRTGRSASKELPLEAPMDAQETAKLLDAGTGLDEPKTAIQPVTPMSLIEMAVGQNADLARLEKLLELQMRWEANEARKAFVEAMNAFKANPPEILKNKSVLFETTKGQRQTSYSHATLDHVCKQVTAGLSEHGISHRWRIEQAGPEIRVTCILTHDMGHSEETTLCAGADQSGSKNAIQAIGSAVTYLERYTLLAATGLAAKGQDDDGHSAAKMDTLQVHLDRIVGSENMTMLNRAFNDAFKEATSLQNTQAMLAIMKAKDNRKKELQREPGE